MLGSTLRWSLCAMALVACTHTPAAGNDGADDDPTSADPAIRIVMTAGGSRAVDIEGVGILIDGSKFDEMVSGQTYELRIVPTLLESGGRRVYELLSYRPAVTLIGTAWQTTDGPAIETINGNTWRLTGSQADALVGQPRLEAPAYDHAVMTVRIHGFAALDGERARVIEYEIVPIYRCLVTPLPVVRIQLANITTDHALDLQEWSTYRGEFQIGAGTCLENAGTYSCQMLSWGNVNETWTFTRPTTDGTFGFTTVSTDTTVAQRQFGCEIIHVADLRAQSDG